MSLSLSRVLVPALLATLGNVRGWLEKPAVRAIEADLLDARIAPDMFPFTRQIQVISDQARMGVARLSGIETPSMPDTEHSLDDLIARIDATVAFVKSADTALIDAAGAHQIELLFPNGGGMRFDGETFATGFVLPNVYFHAAIAYALIRGRGVEIGKADFLANLAPHFIVPA